MRGALGDDAMFCDFRGFRQDADCAASKSKRGTGKNPAATKDPSWNQIPSAD